MAMITGGKTNAKSVPKTNPITEHIHILSGNRLKNIASPPINVVYSLHNIYVTKQFVHSLIPA